MTSRNTRRSITVSCWNIDCAFKSVDRNRVCKLEDRDLQSILCRNDVFFLAETTAAPATIFNKRNNIRPKSLNATKYIGGIAVGFRNPIKAQVELLKFNSISAIWVRLKKAFFGIDCDLHIGSVYIPPKTSPYFTLSDNAFDIIEADVAKFPKWRLQCQISTSQRLVPRLVFDPSTTSSIITLQYSVQISRHKSC